MQYMIVGNPKRKKRSSKRRRRASAVRVVHKRSSRRRRHRNPAAMSARIGGLDVMSMALGAGGALAIGAAGSAIADRMNVSVVNAKTEPEVLGAKLGRLGIRAGLIAGAGLVGWKVFKNRAARHFLSSAALGAGVVLLVDAVRAFAPQLAIGDDEMGVLPEEISGYVTDRRLGGYVADPRTTSPLNGGVGMLEPLYG